MIPFRIFRNAAAILCVATFLVISACHFDRQTLPTDAAGACVDGSNALTDADVNSWFNRAGPG